MDHEPPQSIRIQDITAPKVLDESACLKKLTTYAAYDIRRCPPREPRKEGRGTWAKAEVVEEQFTQQDIVKQIKKLNGKGRSVADKKKALSQFQQGQLTVLLDDLAAKEQDHSFEWSLVQLDCVKKPIYLKPKPVQVGGVQKPANPIPSGSKQLHEMVSMTAFVMRAPLKDLDPIMLLRDIEDMKLRPPPPPPGQTPGFNGPPPPPPPVPLPLGSLGGSPPLHRPHQCHDRIKNKAKEMMTARKEVPSSYEDARNFLSPNIQNHRTQGPRKTRISIALMDSHPVTVHTTLTATCFPAKSALTRMPLQQPSSVVQEERNKVERAPSKAGHYCH